jgi:hypothetical protein
MLIEQQKMFGKVGERVFGKPSEGEQLARKSILRGFTLEVLDTFGTGDVYQIRDGIDQLHPLNPKHWWDSKTNATPKEIWQTLFMMQFEEGSVGCDPVPIVDPHTGKETGKVRFLWSRAIEE